MTSRSSKSNGNSSYQNPRSLNNIIIGDFKIGSKLGQGTFSKVCQGIHMPTGEKVAIKIMSKNQIKEKSDKIRIEKEINIQKKLHHQNIVQQYAIIETESTIYIISEYCSGGELFDYIVSKRKLYEVEACRIYQQLISGLEYLHKQRICHRDLKPENLLFDSKHNLKIADFGLSNDYHKGKLSTPCGSPCYAAPEMVTGKKYSGSSVDIWSSGIVLYTMVCGFLPFEDDNQNILFGKIAKGLFSLPSFLSQSCKDLLKKILVTDPKKRYGFEEIKHHAWFMSVNNVMGKNIFFNSPGVFVGEDVIPIDVEIIAEIYNDFHIDIEKVVNDVLRNRHNKITTTYYLILKRKVRNNENSVSDISSNSSSFIKYIKSSISKMGYWNNDYDKIIEYYVKLVKKFLNSISEENSMSTSSRNKINNNTNNNSNSNNNGNINSNKENNNINNGNINFNNDKNNNLKTEETNLDKLNIKKITNNNNSNDYRVYTELNNNIIFINNKDNNKYNNNVNNKNNTIALNQPLQNGGIDIRISTLYDDKVNLMSIKPYLDTKNEVKDRNMSKLNYEQDSDEPPVQKINESYKPKITMQECLQTDANNIKINNRLIKETVEMDKDNKFNQLNINKNINILKSEESTNIGDNNKNYEPKETTLPNVERILLTEMDSKGIKSLQNSLLNKSPKINNENNDIINNYKNKNKLDNNDKNMNKMDTDNNECVRKNTLYNKDDSDDNMKINIKNDNNINIIQTDTNNIDNIKRNSFNKKENINNNKTESTDKNDKNISKAINGLNDNNQNYSNNNKTKSVENIIDDSNKVNNNKNYNNPTNKEKGNKFFLNIPYSNHIYKKLTTYSEKQERILKFINQKNSSIPKMKEDSKRESTNNNIDLENGKYIYNKNKYKYKNRYSQEPNIKSQNRHIYNMAINGITKPNGSNEICYINKNININMNNDIPFIKKKKKPKSIDDNMNRINAKLYKELKINENNKNNNSFTKKDSKTNVNNNEFYLKINNNFKKNIYKDILNDKKFLEEQYIDSFRLKKKNKIQNIIKLNKRPDFIDSNNISNISNKANNNYFIEKMKNRENYNVILNKDINNYTNISINKNNRLHEHNSFDIPKNIKNKLNRNYINNSIDKMNKNINNNIIPQYNQNYYKLNKKIKHYFRNVSTKPNSTITQYYGINNFNNYNFDNYDKLLNEKISNQKNNNFKIINKNKSNSVDLQPNKSIENNDKLKNKRKFYLNTSVIKDKTPKKLFTSFFLDKNRPNNNKNNYYLNTMGNNYINTNNSNIYKNNNIDEGRYMTFKDNDSMKSVNSTRRNQFHKYIFPIHKRYNFSQEPEKKRRENEVFETFTTYGKGNSFILSNANKNIFLFNKDKKNMNKYEYNNIKNINILNKNIIYDKQHHFITNSNNDNKNYFENKNNGNNININMIIYSKQSIDKIKENVERIISNKVNISRHKNSSIKHLECKYKDGSNSLNFILNISKNSGQRDYLIVSPALIKGNSKTFKLIFEKIKNKIS